MNQPNAPRPPKWPFFLGDAALCVAAIVIFYFDTTPLSAGALTAIVACVGLGAVLAVIPFLLDFAAAQRAFDTELRTRFEAENHKLNHSAELIAGATSHIKSVHDAAARAVHAAESLPYRVQEKIGEFTAQLQQIEDDDKAALEKEIELLRDAEGQKLGEVADKIRAATKEFSALEKEVRPALEAVVKQSREIEESLKSSTTQARAALLGAESKVKSAENSARAALEAIEARLDARLAELKKLEASLTAVPAPVHPPQHAPAVSHEPTAPHTSRRRSEPKHVEPVAPPSEEVPAAATPAALDPVVEAHTPAGPAVVEIPAPVSESVVESVAAPVAAEETVPTPVAAAPSVPTKPRRAVSRLSAFPTDNDNGTATAVEAPPAEMPRRAPSRKSTLRSVDDSALPGFADHEIVYDDALSPGAPTAAKTSDGTTRLLVTAYIGIGNKVFIRGDGPGLSWEQGVPLDFISIGKWSWQVTESAGPIKVQLYKNDETKALGEPLVLEPGHHIEVRPVFREPDPF